MGQSNTAEAERRKMMSSKRSSDTRSPEFLPILLLTMFVLIVFLGYAVIHGISHDTRGTESTPEPSASETSELPTELSGETTAEDTSRESVSETTQKETSTEGKSTEEKSTAESTKKDEATTKKPEKTTSATSKTSKETTTKKPKETVRETTSKKGTALDADTLFKNSLFIGDSRTEGLRLFSGIKSGTFYSNTGLTVDQVSSVKFVTDGKTKKTVIQALQGKKFDKILIALGMNELGWPSAKVYSDKYQEMIKQIRKYQPKTPIYIQSIIQVSKSKSDSHAYMTRENVNKFNAALKKLADNKTIFYIDVNPKLIDKNGYLKADYSSDGVHLVYAKYAIWLQELVDYFNK